MGKLARKQHSSVSSLVRSYKDRCPKAHVGHEQYRAKEVGRAGCQEDLRVLALQCIHFARALVWAHQHTHWRVGHIRIKSRWESMPTFSTGGRKPVNRSIRSRHWSNLGDTQRIAVPPAHAFCACAYVCVHRHFYTLLWTPCQSRCNSNSSSSFHLFGKKQHRVDEVAIGAWLHRRCETCSLIRIGTCMLVSQCLAKSQLCLRGLYRAVNSGMDVQVVD
eukprot:1158401-Pelagomonas_calceolata.AAC.1